MLLTLLGLAVGLGVGIAPVWALDSGWAETEGGRMRLVVDPAPRDDGSIGGFLDVDLEPGWKTYWRDPGGAGIPPMIDFSQSRGVAFEAMHYPPPERVDDGYAIWAGYTAPVRFPLTFSRTGSGDAQFHASAFIGICEKICVPFQAELVVDMPGETVGHDAAAQAVDAAFARLPETAGPDFSVETAQLVSNATQLTISARLPAFRPSGIEPDLFVTGPDGYAFAPPELIRDDGGTAEWTVRIEPPSNRPAGAADVQLDIVVTLGQRALGQSVTATPAPAN